MSKGAQDKLQALKQVLSVQIQRTPHCRNPRLENIEWVERLPRKGLKNKVLERQVLIKDINGETLYIQYPGKESERKRDQRPWDFRPKVYDNSGNPVKDMSFSDIWGSLYDELYKTNRHNSARVLAVLFYRMAFMVDHKKVAPTKTPCRLVQFQDGKQSSILLDNINLCPPPWVYEPPRWVIKELSKSVPSLGGLSLEAFLRYNELLAWNEDSKYYYRDTKATGPSASLPWKDRRRGRMNTLLTHVKIIGFIVGEIKAADLFGSLAGRGVAPASSSEVKRICAGFISDMGTKTTKKV